MNAEAASLVAQADRATADRDFSRAISLLQAAAKADPAEPTIPMRLAGLRRAQGDLQESLRAIDAALTLVPLDFMALVMKADLLDRLGDARRGSAWAHALAQQPEGPLPPQIASVIEQGKRIREEWMVARETRLAAGRAEARLSESADERRRIDRFCSNALRRTKPYHSEPTHYHFPELLEREFHGRDRFPWLVNLEASTNEIAAELNATLAAERNELVPYIQYADHQPLRQWKTLNRNADWTAIHLLRNGRRVEANAAHCPVTMALLETLPQPVIAGASPNAMFSLLAPHTHIPPHVGINNARLVCHLPLIVPDGCWFRVGAEIRPWRRGEAFVFDDTIEHEAMNPSDTLRIVLIVDVWHPDLTAVEREAVATIIAADGAVFGAGI